MLNNPKEKPVSLDQSVATASAVSQGDFPGQGSGQIDHIVIVDNVDATHPLNLDYIIPSNFQRLLSARLSFKLRAFRSYVQAVNNPSTTTSGGSSHSHAVVDHTHVTPNHNHLIFSFASAAPGAASDIQYSGQSSGGGPYTIILRQPSASISTTDLYAAGNTGGATSAAGGGQTSSSENSHTHSVTSNVSLTYGVFEGVVAAGVTVKIDGTDITAQLKPAGPYSVDRIELDLRPFMIPARITTGVFHTIALTPGGLGRIHGFLRLQYFVDGQIG